MKLDITPAAATDIREIFSYSLTNWGEAKARKYVADLRRRMHALARGSTSGTRADDISAGLRRLIAGSHVIWFRIQGDRLRIIRILHQSRDAGRWLG